MRNLAGGGVGAARFGRPRRELRSARWPVVRPGPAVPPVPSTPVAVGFCSIRGWLPACRRRVVVLMTPFPPFGGGDVAV